MELRDTIIEALRGFESPLVSLISRGSRGSGLGHLYRSLYLARDLRKEGIRTAFNRRIDEAQAVIIDLPDREETLRWFSSLPSDRLRVVFDNGGTLLSLETDVLVYPDFLPIEGVEFKSKRVLSGWNFVYPPLEIRLLKGVPRGRDVLILFGGSDPRGYTREFLLTLLKIGFPKGVIFHFLFGPMNRDYRAFLNLSFPENVRIYKSIMDPSPLYRSSSVVVSSGGLSFAYSVFLERFTIGIPQNEMEGKRIRFYSQRYPFVRFAPTVEDAVEETLLVIEGDLAQ